MKRKLLVLVSALLTIVFVLSLSSCKKENNDVEDTADTVKNYNVDLVIDTEAPETQKPEPVVTSASFIGAGDNIIYYGNVREAASLAYSGGRTYNFKPMYSEVADYIAAADLAYINQETVMCGDGWELSYYPTFNSPQDLGYDLAEIGFDIINIANNHMLDKGGDGLQATIDFWKTLPVTMIGGNSSREEYDDVEIIEKNGIRIALLSYCEMTNGLRVGKGRETWIPYLNNNDPDGQTDIVDDTDIVMHCESVKGNCDFIIASVHWGQEGSFTPSEKQKNYAQAMADAGVDVIIGTHPHVLQPIEWLTGKDGNKTLCVYSLGDFMAEQDRDYNMVGGFISFDITKVDDEHATCENVKFVPTVFDFQTNFYNNKVYFMENYTEQMAASHGIAAYGQYTSLDKLKYYVTNTISDEFLPDFLVSGN